MGERWLRPASATERVRLLGQADHDLRTPLAVMRGWIETLATAGDRLPPERRRAGFEALTRNASDLTVLFESLLAQVRAAAFADALSAEVVGLQDWLGEAVTAGLADVEAGTQEVRVHAAAGTAIHVARTAARLMEVDLGARPLRVSCEVSDGAATVHFEPTPDAPASAPVSASHVELLRELRLQALATLAEINHAEAEIAERRVSVRMTRA